MAQIWHQYGTNMSQMCHKCVTNMSSICRIAELRVCIRAYRCVHVRAWGAVHCPLTELIAGHNYMGHEYLGHNNIGHDYIGHNYFRHADLSGYWHRCWY